jgi:hypothetical protein
MTWNRPCSDFLIGFWPVINICTPPRYAYALAVTKLVEPGPRVDKLTAVYA